MLPRQRRRNGVRVVRVKLVNAPLLHPRHPIGVHRLRKRRIARLTGRNRVPLRQLATKFGIRTKALKGLGNVHVQADLGVSNMLEYSISDLGLAAYGSLATGPS